MTAAGRSPRRPAHKPLTKTERKRRRSLRKRFAGENRKLLGELTSTALAAAPLNNQAGSGPPNPDRRRARAGRDGARRRRLIILRRSISRGAHAELKREGLLETPRAFRVMSREERRLAQDAGQTALTRRWQRKETR